MTTSTTGPCPCGSGKPYASCCGPFHAGTAQAPTAEQLMRSRFSAFARHDAPYLLRTWAPETRPTSLDLDHRLRWQRLEILSTTEGGPFHQEGTVEFRAHYREGKSTGALHEHSRFRRDHGAWVYVDGDIRD
ncbi:YchJ family protein [Streptacidiphilus neutrinimicus]|uniref:YchJ family protein n=1 Tax=Streptacidiphilus neutrinimicus TaxID=105420 RepID=UPI0005AB087D|nr:YchJ family protein [Streptacidiphilus neutrinimicus]